LSVLTGGFILASVLITSIISGVFGMAGGLLLMGTLALVLPVSAAFVTHGLIQIVSNGWRAWLHRAHVRWSILGFYTAGAALALWLVRWVQYAPQKPAVFLALGLVAMLVWLPRRWIHLDAARPIDGLICGLGVTGLNLIAGVAGPLLDVFFVRTAMTRHQIVATKAATQVVSHLAKVMLYGAPLLLASGSLPLSPAVFVLAIPMSMLGTVIGGRVLDRMTDKGFLNWTKWIISAIGVWYLVEAWQSLGT
jgi:uncharacterized membrane protein YfcA